jgi:hypothetical protein
MEFASEPKPATGNTVRPGYQDVQAKRIGIIRAIFRPRAENFDPLFVPQKIEAGDSSSK